MTAAKPFVVKIAPHLSAAVHVRMLEDGLATMIGQDDIAAYASSGGIDVEDLIASEASRLDVHALLQDSDYERLSTWERAEQAYQAHVRTFHVAIAATGLLLLIFAAATSAGALAGALLTFVGGVALWVAVEGRRPPPRHVREAFAGSSRLTSQEAELHREAPPLGFGIIALIAGLYFLLISAALIDEPRATVLPIGLGLSAAVGLSWALTKSEAARQQFDRLIGAYLQRSAIPGGIDAARSRWVGKVGDQLKPTLLTALDHKLGKRRDTVLVPTNTRGLQLQYDESVLIHSEAGRRLNAMLEHMDGGTVALCGPRGAGKSTILRQLSARGLKNLPANAVVIRLAAPSRYDTRDFLVNLTRRLAEAVLEADPLTSIERHDSRSLSKRLAGLLRRVLNVTRSGAAIVLFLLAMFLLILRDDDSRDTRSSAAKWLTGFITQVDDHISTAIANPAAWATIYSLPLAALLLVVSFALYLLPPLNTEGRRAAPHLEVRLAQEALRRIDYQESSTQSREVSVPLIRALQVKGSSNSTLARHEASVPDLITQFVALSTAITRRRSARRCGLVIAIDELDRIGTSEEVESFLGEVKGIFEAPQSLFLLAMTDTVGWSHLARSVVGSSLLDNVIDAVLWVDGLSLTETANLLKRRVSGFTDVFVGLTFALTGGNPRETIRLARRLVEIGQPDANHVSVHNARVDHLAATIVRENVLNVLDYCLAGPEGRSGDNADGFEHLAGLRVNLRKPEADPSFLRSLLDEAADALARPGGGVGDSGDVLARLHALLVLESAVLTTFAHEHPAGASEVLPLEGAIVLLGEARRHVVVRPAITTRMVASIFASSAGKYTDSGHKLLATGSAPTHGSDDQPTRPALSVPRQRLAPWFRDFRRRGERPKG